MENNQTPGIIYQIFQDTQEKIKRDKLDLFLWDKHLFKGHLPQI